MKKQGQYTYNISNLSEFRIGENVMGEIWYENPLWLSDKDVFESFNEYKENKDLKLVLEKKINGKWVRVN